MQRNSIDRTSSLTNSEVSEKYFADSDAHDELKIIFKMYL